MSLDVRRRGGWRLAALGSLLLLLLGTPGAWAVATLAQDPAPAQENPPPQTAVSPASGHAQVVATGLAVLPTGSAAWRVTYRTLQPGAPATAERDGAGFAVGDQGSLLLDGDPAGRRALLAPGEAAFVAGAAELRRVAAGERPAGSFAIELIPAAAAAEEAPPSGGRIPVFTSDPFPAPAGERNLALVRDRLTPGEVTTVAAGDAPTLVVATLGAIDVQASDGEAEATTLRVGQAAAFDGALELTGSGQAPATFLAAVVGLGLSEGPAGTPVAVATPVTTTPPGAASAGAVTAIVHACPTDVEPAEATPDRCPRAAGAVELRLTDLDGGNPRPPRPAAGSDGVPVWTDLPFGDYALRAVGLDTGFGRFFVPGLPGIGGPPEAGYAVAPDRGYRLRLSEAAPAFRLDVYAIGGDAPRAATPRAAAAAGTTGSITVRPLACPGSDVADVDPAACRPLRTFFAATLAGGGLAAPLRLADAEAGPDNSRVWDDLPFGDYVFVETVLPAGATTYFVPGSAAVGLLPDDSGYGVTIDESAPDIVLDVYNVVGPSAAPPPSAGETPAAAPPPVADALPEATAAPPPVAPPLSPPLPPPLPLPTANALPATLPTPPPTPEVSPTAVPDVPTAVPPAPTAAAEPTAPPTEAPAPTPPPATDLDSDGDGLTDAAETAIYGTDPNAFDTDGDGSDDGAEIFFGTNPFAADTAVPTESPAPDATAEPIAPTAAPAPDTTDSDGDGLTDVTEGGIGTNPFNDDSDGDGWLDSNEINLGTNPLDPESQPVSP